MKISIERNDLVDGLSTVTSIVESRNTIPILSNVLFTAKDGGVTLTTTDLDMELVEKRPAVVEQEGAVTVSAKDLFKLVSKFANGAEIRLEVSKDGNQLLVSTGKQSNYKFPTLPAGDFHVISLEKSDNEFEIHAGNLRRLMNKVRFAISHEETRYYLNGVYFHTFSDGETKKFRAVATDGHRLSCVDTEAPEGSENFEDGAIVPRKAVAVIDKMIAGVDDNVHIAASETMIRVTLGLTTITSKLIDGKFPDYKRVIPTGNNIKLALNNKVFEDAVDRVATMSIERSRAIKMALAENSAVISVERQEIGSGTEEIDAEFSEEPMEIGFNALYLLDIVRLIEDDNIEFFFEDANSPAIMLDPADSDARYVLMPLRV